VFDIYALNFSETKQQCRGANSEQEPLTYARWGSCVDTNQRTQSALHRPESRHKASIHACFRYLLDRAFLRDVL